MFNDEPSSAHIGLSFLIFLSLINVIWPKVKCKVAEASCLAFPRNPFERISTFLNLYLCLQTQSLWAQTVLFHSEDVDIIVLNSRNNYPLMVSTTPPSWLIVCCQSSLLSSMLLFNQIRRSIWTIRASTCFEEQDAVDFVFSIICCTAAIRLI